MQKEVGTAEEKKALESFWREMRYLSELTTAKANVPQVGHDVTSKLLLLRRFFEKPESNYFNMHATCQLKYLNVLTIFADEEHGEPATALLTS